MKDTGYVTPQMVTTDKLKITGPDQCRKKVLCQTEGKKFTTSGKFYAWLIL